MKQTPYKIVCAVMAVFFMGTSPVFAKAQKSGNTEVPKEWTIWLENLKREMLSKGISQKTIDAAYKGKNYYHVVSDVVQKDKKQTEFILTTCKYVNRLVTADRVKKAREHYITLQKKYKDIEDKYNVPLNYLVAFWAIETNFGSNKGNYHLIDSLTNLSYKNRRADFFKNELYNVLKIMEKTKFDEDKMRGSWAGAMGHFQFMPSTYNNYAVDYDGDNVPDIWNSFGDALASAGNYLSQLGWKKNEKWGMRVSLPWNFSFKEVGRQNTKKVAEWKKLGVKTFYGYSLPLDDEAKASVILPDGRKGPAFIVLGNFKRVMIWNRSDNYAVAIVTLADYVANPNKKWSPMQASTQYVMTNEEIKLIQKFYNSLYPKKITEDGQLGPKTREAVRILQKRARLPEDGYPDYMLLNKIKNYDAKIGFATPVQPRKQKK
jgi:membrane-bound lytic murein transglycosylase B